MFVRSLNYIGSDPVIKAIRYLQHKTMHSGVNGPQLHCSILVFPEPSGDLWERLWEKAKHRFRDLCTAGALSGPCEELAILLLKRGIDNLIIVLKCSCTFRAERGIGNFIDGMRKWKLIISIKWSGAHTRNEMSTRNEIPLHLTFTLY